MGPELIRSLMLISLFSLKTALIDFLFSDQRCCLTILLGLRMECLVLSVSLAYLLFQELMDLSYASKCSSLLPPIGCVISMTQ